MFVILAHNWWTLLLRGIRALVFGVLCFVYPGLTLLVLAMLFGAYALVDGIFAVVAAVSAPKGQQRWWITLLRASSASSKELKAVSAVADLFSVIERRIFKKCLL